VAGCIASGDDPGGADTGSTPDRGPTDTATAEPATPTPDHPEASELDRPDSVGDWLADANGYDGEIPRETASDRPEIRVGHESDGGPAFAPAAVEVPPNTRVAWNWTGNGVHNVVALDGTFDSGRVNGQPGTCYHYFFEEPGEYYFVSERDANAGMKGAVVVKEPPSTGYPKVDEWVVHTDNYDGSVTDRTGTERATVMAGVPGNGGNFAFDPPVLKVSTGTTVAWEWTGEGGGHDVRFHDLDAGSGDITPAPGVHFEYTFDSAGVYRYACAPHRALGMVGAVVVE
jgi:halocyanin-like protein